MNRCISETMYRTDHSIMQLDLAFVGVWVAADTSCDQDCNEGVEQGFAAATRVVHESEEAEMERQLVLRDGAMPEFV